MTREWLVRNLVKIVTATEAVAIALLVATGAIQ
jgi:hypothetical protein